MASNGFKVGVLVGALVVIGLSVDPLFQLLSRPAAPMGAPEEPNAPEPLASSGVLQVPQGMTIQQRTPMAAITPRVGMDGSVEVPSYLPFGKPPEEKDQVDPEKLVEQVLKDSSKGQLFVRYLANDAAARAQLMDDGVSTLEEVNSVLLRLSASRNNAVFNLLSLARDIGDTQIPTRPMVKSIILQAAMRAQTQTGMPASAETKSFLSSLHKEAPVSPWIGELSNEVDQVLFSAQ